MISCREFQFENLSYFWRNVDEFGKCPEVCRFDGLYVVLYRAQTRVSKIPTPTQSSVILGGMGWNEWVSLCFQVDLNFNVSTDEEAKTRW